MGHPSMIALMFGACWLGEDVKQWQGLKAWNILRLAVIDASCIGICHVCHDSCRIRADEISHSSQSFWVSSFREDAVRMFPCSPPEIHEKVVATVVVVVVAGGGGVDWCCSCCAFQIQSVIPLLFCSWPWGKHGSKIFKETGASLVTSCFQRLSYEESNGVVGWLLFPCFRDSEIIPAMGIHIYKPGPHGVGWDPRRMNRWWLYP